MKTKNLIYLLTGLVILGVSSFIYNNSYFRKGAIFNHLKHMKKCIDWKVEEDGCTAKYNFKKAEVTAHYKILGYNINGVFYDTNAFKVEVDKNRDGRIELLLEDKDDNGTLEDRTKYKKSKQPQGIPI